MSKPVTKCQKCGSSNLRLMARFDVLFKPGLNGQFVPVESPESRLLLDNLVPDADVKLSCLDCDHSFAIGSDDVSLKID